MRFAVAIASPANFQHSKAFDEVAEALHYGLLQLGHESVVTDRLDLDDRRTIVLGGNVLVRHGLRPPRDPIFYNLEQLGDDLPSMTLPAFRELFQRYPTWDYSHANIERLAAMGLPRPTYVPIGYVPELTRIAPAPRDIDVLFYGASYERRYAVLRDLHDRGVRVKWLSGVYGARRDAWIARSKIVLNMHYWEAKIFEIVRVSYLLANKQVVVSERGANPAVEEEFATGVAFADYDRLADRCVELLHDESARQKLAQNGFDIISTRDQAEILHRALNDLEDFTPQRSAGADTGSDEHARIVEPVGNVETRERELFKHKFAPDRDRWLAAVDINPGDARSVFFLAETCFQTGDYVDACGWYERRIDMGGCEEEVYWARYRRAASMAEIGAPWSHVQQAYLEAWEFRPTRAEALYAIVFQYLAERRYRLGHLFAQRVAEIPFPDNDLLVLDYHAEIYAWRATDARATCAFWIGRHAESFTLCRRLLARDDLPEGDRQRIAANRDFSVPATIEAAIRYPENLVRSLTASPRRSEVTVSLIAGPNSETTEQALNSFVNCCLDVSRAGRFLVLDIGLLRRERDRLQQRYGFIEFVDGHATAPAARLAALRAHVTGQFWLHLACGWRFFAPDNYVTRLAAVLHAEPHVFQVGVNLVDAAALTGTSASDDEVRHAPHAGRYVLTTHVAQGPAMFDMTRADEVLGAPTSSPSRGTATLDEVLCVADPGTLHS